MSLTSYLNENDVRERFRHEFTKPKFAAKRDLLAAPVTKHYGLVGTAFDYLLRFYLKWLNPKAIDRESWIAEQAVGLLAHYPSLHSAGENAISVAKERLERFLKTGDLTDGLVESALLLAQLDPIFRAGRGYEEIGNIYDEDKQDLRNLISFVEPDLFRAQNLCLLNPTFGFASLMVGGADADLVIDDTIIDIKATQKLELRIDDFHQLIGYYVLHEIGGVGDLKPRCEIKRVAIYFARYAYFHPFDIETIIDRSTFPDFVHWFKHRASQIWKPKSPLM